MDKTCIVGEIKPRRKLDCNIIYFLNVGPWHINCQVKFKTLDVVKNVAVIVALNHGELAT